MKSRTVAKSESMKFGSQEYRKGLFMHPVVCRRVMHILGVCKAAFNLTRVQFPAMVAAFKEQPGHSRPRNVSVLQRDSGAKCKCSAERLAVNCFSFLFVYWTSYLASISVSRIQIHHYTRSTAMRAQLCGSRPSPSLC
jgi:hypothetical protein